jgi:hypothetical protein
MDFHNYEMESAPTQGRAIEQPAQNNRIPSLATKETARLREDYPAIEYLEAGKVASWLVERQDQLLMRAKEERVGMNLSKLITLAGGAVGAICYATSPLAPLGALIAGVGYVWAVAEDLNNSHQFAPIPFVRGNFLEFLAAMGDSEAREKWFADKNEIVDLMNHLEPFERYEFVMLRGFTNTLTDFLHGVEPGKRFYAYRWLLDNFINYKGGFPTIQQLHEHLATVTTDPRINYQHVEILQQQQPQLFHGIPQPQFMELPQSTFIELPKPSIVEPVSMPAPKPPAPAPPPNLQKLLSLPLNTRAIALIDILQASGFDLAKCIKDQITIICGNQRGGKGTLMAILAILSKALEPTTKIHYLTAGDDIYPFRCDRLVCRLSYPELDGAEADARVARELYAYLKAMDNATQGTYQDIILVIDEAVALSDYLDDAQKQWIIRFLLTRANKKGAQIFVVLHGKNLSSWVGSKNTEGFSSTFKTGVTFVGCEATSKKLSPLKSISVATGHYFLADPDSFEKAVKDGEIGTIPDWLKTEINPATLQPDPARTLLKFFPELVEVTSTLEGEESPTATLKQNLEKLLVLEVPNSDRPTPQSEQPTPKLSEAAQKVIQAVKDIITSSLTHYTASHFIAAREIYRHDRTLNAQETKDAIQEIVVAKIGESRDGSDIRLLKM